MAALWPRSGTIERDVNGIALVHAQVFFYNVNTTTPQTTYFDSALGATSTIDADGAVYTDGNGRWPQVYLGPTPGSYRERALAPYSVGVPGNGTPGALLFDYDGVSVPQAADFVPPDAGTTDPTLLFATGMVVDWHCTGTQSGWVRGNGRSIGSATSGATERANSDTSALFQFLWTQDSTLTVSSGRGANAASDFAANKTLTLPDYRQRSRIGLGDMGNTTSTLFNGVTIDNSETVTTLGATAGAATVVLTTPQIPSHTHTFAGDALPAHHHTVDAGDQDAGGGMSADGQHLNYSFNTSGVSAGTPSGTNASTGGGAAHTNVQPSVLVTIYIKL